MISRLFILKANVNLLYAPLFVVTKFVETDKITMYNMQYPLISEYVTVIQDAGDNLEQLAHLTPVLDDHGEPYRSSGAFAVVFKMQDKSTGKYYALKCFTEEQEGRAEAYRQIADELDMVDSPYITSVKYMEKELFVDSQCEEDEFPVLLMDWVDGETMEAYIAANYHNQSAMSMLCYRFGKMAAWLRSQSFAHGDVKPDNIIIRPDGSLTLVDYDGMFVSSMKGSKSPTVGTKDFCHPLRTMDDFDETIDDFSLASIALSLKAISMKPTLLDIYGASDRLLFSENDYRNPSNSKVISALQGLMCDKDFCTLYSLFMLALARKELSTCSFRLFIGEKPILPQTIEDLSTKATDEELREAFIDEWGVKYSKDGRKLLKAPKKLDGIYSIRKGTKIICEEAFRWSKFIGCRSLTSLVIPDSVTNIGDYAFSGCRSLTDIVIPDSVTRIGDGAFRGCKSLTDIVIPNSVTSIGDNAFEYCFSLSNLVIPDGVTSIEDNAFEGCYSLSSVVIPDSVSCIGFGAFENCSSLTDIVIPDSVTSIGGYAFGCCESLTDIVIPNSVTSIGDNAFWYCKSLSSVVIPAGVTSIGARAFCECSSLISIVIPDGITCIGESAFCVCSTLSSVVIPDSVTSIGNYAFAYCKSLTDIVIPNSVTSIGDNAFRHCSSLSSLVIPESVVNLNGNPFCRWDGELKCLSPYFIYDNKVLFNKDKSKIIAFRDKNTTSYVIPDSVTRIGGSAFANCSSLSRLVIPNSVTSIGESAFWHCFSLSSLVIPNSVTSVGKWAFEGCISLGSLVIPDGVTSIGDGAFRDCSSLTSLVIPNGVTSIGDNAFRHCSSLRSIVIPDSVTSIGGYAFLDCKSLTSLVIPDSVTSIGDNAFRDCCSLKSLVIPNSVTSIGESAFWGCNFPNDIEQELISRFGEEIFEETF